MTIEDQFAVGPGVREMMEQYQDEPRSDEEYVRPNISETYGRDAVYVYYAQDNLVQRLPFA